MWRVDFKTNINTEWYHTSGIAQYYVVHHYYEAVQE